MKKRGAIFSGWPVLLAAVFMIQGGCGNGTEESAGFDARNVGVTASASVTTGGYAWTWKNGEKFSVYTTGASSDHNAQFSLSSVAAAGTSGTLSGTIRQTAAGTHTFSAAYPYSASAAADPVKYVINVPMTQNITTGGIDPSAYVLVGAPVSKDISAADSGVQLSGMTFSSPLAVGKLSFTNQGRLATDEKITAVQLHINRDPDITGDAYYDLTSASAETNVFATSGGRVMLSYPDGSEPTAAGTFDAWFTSFPFTIVSGDTYTAIVYTDRQAVKGQIRAGANIRFAPGLVTTVPVTIDSTFETDTPLMGKGWPELPDVISGDRMRGKTYHAVMKDDKKGRNFSILYDMTEKLSLWVAFPMNRNLHLGTGRDNEPWHYDTDGDIAKSMQPDVISGTYGTYAQDNLSRGHQIANSDRNGTEEARVQTFVMTNLTPQKQDGFNSGVWSGLEGAIKTVAEAASTPDQDTLYVVTGPLLDPGDPRYIKDKSNDDCRVPDGYFKVILWSKYYAGERKFDSVGFMFENKSYTGTGISYADRAFPVGDVEQATGFKFFGNLGLSDEQMSAIKSTATWSSFSNRSTNPQY